MQKFRAFSDFFTHIWLLSQHSFVGCFSLVVRSFLRFAFSPSINWVGLIERWEQCIRDTKVSRNLRFFCRYMFSSSISKTKLLSIICFGLLRYGCIECLAYVHCCFVFSSCLSSDMFINSISKHKWIFFVSFLVCRMCCCFLLEVSPSSCTSHHLPFPGVNGTLKLL